MCGGVTWHTAQNGCFDFWQIGRVCEAKLTVVVTQSYERRLTCVDLIHSVCSLDSFMQVFYAVNLGKKKGHQSTRRRFKKKERLSKACSRLDGSHD